MCIASTTPSGGYAKTGPGGLTNTPPLPPPPTATDVSPASRSVGPSDLDRQRRPLNPLGLPNQPRLGL